MAQGAARPATAPVELGLDYKVIWGVAGLGTSLISGIYAALLAGAAILRWFPLRGAYLAQAQQQVLELHAKKRAQLEKAGN